MVASEYVKGFCKPFYTVYPNPNSLFAELDKAHSKAIKTKADYDIGVYDGIKYLCESARIEAEV